MVKKNESCLKKLDKIQIPFVLDYFDKILQECVEHKIISQKNHKDCISYFGKQFQSKLMTNETPKFFGSQKK